MVNEPLNERPGKLDRLQLAALAGLMFIGTLFVYSATMANPTLSSQPWYDHRATTSSMVKCSFSKCCSTDVYSSASTSISRLS